MTLGFMQTWPKEMAMQDKKTYFIEKINLGLLKSQQTKAIDYVESLEDYRSKFGKNWDVRPNLKPKIHTIRKDDAERWKTGMKIHFVVNNRSSNRFQFAPVVQCASIQIIEIIWSVDGTRPLILKIDGSDFNPCGFTVKKLAINDGFESVGDFFKYFNQDFKGRLIHWTNLRY